jgi:hypothetical protein
MVASVVEWAVMTDFAHALRTHTDLSIEAQIKAGQPLDGDMPASHVRYLQLLCERLDAQAFSLDVPSSFVITSQYDAAPEAVRGKIDLVLPTVAHQTQRIISFFRDPRVPNACPQLRTMIDHLWDILRRLGPSSSMLTLPPLPADAQNS